MHRIVALVALIIASPAAAFSNHLEFTPPAILDYEQSDIQGEWLFIIGRPTDELALQLVTDGNAAGPILKTSRLFVNQDDVIARYPIQLLDPDEDSHSTAAPHIEVASNQRWFATLIFGEVTVQTKAPNQARIEGIDGLCFRGLGEAEVEQAWMMHSSLCPSPEAVLSLQGATDSADTIFSVEKVGGVWLYNLTTNCAGARTCIDGGGYERHRQSATPSTYIEQRTQWYGGLTQGVLNVSGTGSFQTLAVGGQEISQHFAGGVRLPLASGTACGASCVTAANETFRLDGQISLLHIQQHGTKSHRLQADVAGEFGKIQLDNSVIPLGTAVSVGTAVGVATLAAVAAKLLGVALASRGADPLKHPNRRKLNDAILAHPGSTFRELLRHTDLPAGTARHHLQVLKQAAIIQEHPHNQTLRYFENHGRFDDSWNTVVLLREPELKRLHGWLREHPGAFQREIVEAADEWGWSRSTTQHRLKRLAGEGLLEVRLQGRLKRYDARKRAPVPERYASIV